MAGRRDFAVRESIGSNLALLSAFLAVLTTALLLAGCERKPAAIPLQPETASAGRLRIVCLAPELTKMLVDMGRGDQIVGVIKEDTLAPKSAEVVGGTFDNPDREKLLSLHPGLVLTMTGGDPPAALKDLAESRGFVLVNYRSPHSVDDVRNILWDFDNPERGLSGVLVDDRAQDLMMHMLRQLREVSRVTEGTKKPYVLLVIGTGPVMAVGPREVLSDLMQRFAGGRNALDDTAGGAPILDREHLLKIGPDVILILIPEAPPLGPIDSDPRLAAFRGLDIPAVKNQRIVLIDDPQVQLRSTSLPMIAAKIARALHPDLSAAIDAALAAGSKPAPHSSGSASQPSVEYGAETRPSATAPAPTTNPHAGY